MAPTNKRPLKDSNESKSKEPRVEVKKAIVKDETIIEDQDLDLGSQVKL